MQMEKAEEAGKAMVLVNPALKDIPSHSGIMGVRCAFRPSCTTLPSPHTHGHKDPTGVPAASL